jgi:hypothetical protein
MNVVTPKVGAAKHVLLFNKPASVFNRMSSLALALCVIKFAKIIAMNLSTLS